MSITGGCGREPTWMHAEYKCCRKQFGKRKMRKITGENLEYYIRSRGFSKESFCRKTGISRVELDRILNEETGSLDASDQQMRQIASALHIDPDVLAGPLPVGKQRSVMGLPGAPEQLQANEKTKKEYDLLQDILNLCNVYY